jgi:DNA-binding XRE family transcriptional regulator
MTYVDKTTSNSLRPAALMGESQSRETLGERLASNLLAARRAARLTQTELARVSRISRATLALLEAGAGDPRLSTLELIAGALHLPLSALLAKMATPGPHHSDTVSATGGAGILCPQPAGSRLCAGRTSSTTMR